MAYRLPVFNVWMNVWHQPNVWPDPPNFSVLVNLTPGRRVTMTIPQELPAGAPFIWMTALCPKLTDVRGMNSDTGSDLVEIPGGSGRFYTVRFVDDLGKGFDNEHRFAVLEQHGVWATPIP